MTAPIGSAQSPVPRRGARVLVVDASGRVLLLRGSDPGRPGSRYWYTVGGGLHDGETEADAAVRELFEETGLRAMPADLRWLFDDVTDFPYAGVWYRQSQAYYVLRVPRYEVPASQSELAADDEHSIDEYRWWSAEELSTTDEKVYPSDLASRLRGIMGGRSVRGPERG